MKQKEKVLCVKIKDKYDAMRILNILWKMGYRGLENLDIEKHNVKYIYIKENENLSYSSRELYSHIQPYYNYIKIKSKDLTENKLKEILFIENL
jgi:hypothetical protein